MKKFMSTSHTRKSFFLIFCNTSWLWTVDYVNQTVNELGKKDDLLICYLYMDGKSWRDIFLRNKNIPIFFSKTDKNTYLYNPFHFIPFRRFKLVETINHKINILIIKLFIGFARLFVRFSRNILWIFDPNLFFVSKCFNRKYFVLYDCVDLFASADMSRLKETNENEKKLCKKANLVVANSIVLSKHLEKYRKDIKLVPQGFRLDDYKYNTRSTLINLKLKSPVIGFIGGINNRLDTSLLSSLIKKNPSWNFVFWGPIQNNIMSGEERSNKIMEILKLPNVFRGESKYKHEIPSVVSQFDIGMIPYDITQDFNKYCYPMKLFEYFYCGKPVVSTDILELRRFSDFVMIGRNVDDWTKILKKIISSDWSFVKKKQEKKIAIENSWENKISKILSFVDTDNVI